MKIKKLLRNIKIIYIPYKKIKIYLVNRKRNLKLQKKGYKVLSDVTTMLKSEKYNIFCAYGTLLGFIRDKGFIAHDCDIDMGIIPTELFDWDKFDKNMNKIGMKLDHQYVMDSGEIAERTYKKDDVSIDFFIYMENKEKNIMYSYVFYKEDENEDTDIRKIRISEAPIIKEIKYEKIHGILVPIIENNIEYLEKVYGPSWNVPDPNYIPKKIYLKERYARVEKGK